MSPVRATISKPAAALSSHGSVPRRTRTDWRIMDAVRPAIVRRGAMTLGRGLIGLIEHAEIALGGPYNTLSFSARANPRQDAPKVRRPPEPAVIDERDVHPGHKESDL